jgi:hypothetical protein
MKRIRIEKPTARPERAWGVGVATPVAANYLRQPDEPGGPDEDRRGQTTR